jgi:hypothetical protein
VLIFYRVVRTKPPSIEDFMSPESLGRVLTNPTAERRRLWQGLSVYDTETRARKKAIKVPLLGAYIAQLEFPDQRIIQYERTTTSAGHYTLWGLPEDLRQAVVRIVPV